MSKDRFDRLDEDLFEKPPAPAPERPRTRFSHEDVLEAAQTQAAILRRQGVTFDPAAMASIRQSEDQLILDELRRLNEPHRVSEPDPNEMPADPRAWLFHVGQNPHHEHESYSGRTWVVFTPIHYWRMNHAQIDAHLEDEPIRARIPAYLEEVTDSTFIANAGDMTVTEIRDDLRNRGFQEDPAFANFIDGLAPVEPVYDQALAQNADVVFRTAFASFEPSDEMPGALRTAADHLAGVVRPVSTEDE